jgi:hypothetical protein
MTASASENEKWAGNRLIIPVQNNMRSQILMLHEESSDGPLFETIWPLIAKHLREHFPKKITQLLLETDCTVAEFYLPSIIESFNKSDLASNNQLFSYAIPPGTQPVMLIRNDLTVRRGF